MTEAVLDQYTIYESPADAPGRFVVRRWEIRPDGTLRACEAFHGATLAAVRRIIPRGLYRLPRDPLDEPHVVEVWT